MLSKRLNYLKNENQIEDFLWFPFSFEEFDKKDIEDRINLLRPDNMYVTFQSDKLKTEKD
jgi:hypothetical protein